MNSDLITEILVRLPVKSIIRFKSVDRSWNDLFTTPTFVTKNTQMLRHNHNNNRLMIFDNQRIKRSSQYKCSITLISDDDDDIPPSHVEPPFLNNAELERFRVLGPHNGVFCFYVYYMDGSIQLLLWNPATREVKALPPPPIMSPRFYSLLQGFGAADPITNDFKLINLVDDDWNGQPSPSAELYTLSANTWTSISGDDVPVGIPIYNRKDAILANGVCHWLIVEREGKEEVSILCFNFRDNQFRRLDPPTQTMDGTTYSHFARCHGYLIEANDSIGYVLCGDQFPYWITEVWILEQDSSWTKKYKFGPLDWHQSIYTFWKDGVEFLGSSNVTSQVGQECVAMSSHTDGPPVRLVSYNSSDGQPVRHFDVNIYSYYHHRLAYYYVCNYKESIVPLSFFPK